MALMLLDEQLHLAPAAVDCLVEKPPVLALQIRHHKPHSRAQRIMLRFEDHAPLPQPGFRPIRKLPKQTHGRPRMAC